MDKIKPLFTATATATGGRNGHTESSDGMVKADLSVPQAMGGLVDRAPRRRNIYSPRATRPASAAPRLRCQAAREGRDQGEGDCAVTIGPREGGGFGLAVKLYVEDKSVPQTDLAGLAKEAHETICPYSHATRSNVEVVLEVVGA